MPGFHCNNLPHVMFQHAPLKNELEIKICIFTWLKAQEMFKRFYVDHID